MTFVRYRHWPAQAALQGEIKQVFDRFLDPSASNEASAAQWMPRVDIREEAARFVIEADLPGIDPQAIEIQMDESVLSIQGERAAGPRAEDGRASRTERRHGAFHRRFVLPDSADAENISASGYHGVLEIVIPKKAQTTPRRIQVGSPTVQ